MDSSKAIQILKKRVETDRRLRDNSTESDYDKFCEIECIAIETLIKGFQSYRNSCDGADSYIESRKESMKKEHYEELKYILDVNEGWNR